MNGSYCKLVFRQDVKELQEALVLWQILPFLLLYELRSWIKAVFPHLRLEKAAHTVPLLRAKHLWLLRLQ